MPKPYRNLNPPAENLTKCLHIARGAHCVLTKNKNYAKNFYSRPYNHLPQKIPCGRGTIFARIVHIRAYIRRDDFFLSGLVLFFLNQHRAASNQQQDLLFYN
jgi:hypothetical protein